MTEYEHFDPDADDAGDALTPDPGYGDQDIDVPRDDAPPAPLPDHDLSSPPPDELLFPGEEPAEPPPAEDTDPAAPFPDDGAFEQWLGDPSSSGEEDDPQADRELREHLAAPPDDAEGLPSSDALTERFLRGD